MMRILICVCIDIICNVFYFLLMCFFGDIFIVVKVIKEIFYVI